MASFSLSIAVNVSSGGSELVDEEAMMAGKGCRYIG